MIKTFALLAVGAVLLGLGACAHKHSHAPASSTPPASSSYSK